MGDPGQGPSFSRRGWQGVAGICVAVCLGGSGYGAASRTDPPWEAFLAAASLDRREAEAALETIAGGWRDGYAAMIVDVARFLPASRGPQASDLGPLPEFEAGFEDDSGAAANTRRDDFPTVSGRSPAAAARQRLTSFLDRQTGQRFGDDLRAWRRWIWAQPYEPHPDYARFKAEVYARIDGRFRGFFPAGMQTRIRLDEVDWGGVTVNGIPPLRAPKTIAASEARWLKDGHVVFGLIVDGEARAYPKRILAWHEMAVDTLGGREITLVYCTLCGTVIPYDSYIGARHFTFGTSGLLYRSNKLMFDEETRSLWSSLEGVPVAGPLTESGLRLAFHPVVTTTWGEWRREHPATSVLSLDTGYRRDYSEGAAYRDYFATDRLMFEVPTADTRLKNKAEVLVIRPEIVGDNVPPVAIAADRLRREPVLPVDAGDRRLIVVTSKAGANAVYERGDRSFVARQADGTLTDSEGWRWSPGADALVGPGDRRLARVPAHRAFWFGWVAQYPNTILLK